jgi:AmmeMemoRadiSam system protein A
MIKKALGCVPIILLGFSPCLAQSIATNAPQPSAETIKTKEANMNVREHRSGAWSPGLTDEEKTTLFAIAKDTLVWCVDGAANKKKGAFPIASYTITPKLKVNTATFVTLKIRGELRGCIGSLAPVEPLYLSVHRNAVNAAMHDYRFSPVQSVELPDITVDVSILSPIRDIPNLDAFKLGQYGIIMSKGMARAVFLPEVATEQGWTKEETLSYLSQKAGLSADAWREGAQFQVFESVVLTMVK